jgi:hypothetical protein
MRAGIDPFRKLLRFENLVPLFLLVTGADVSATLPLVRDFSSRSTSVFHGCHDRCGPSFFLVALLLCQLNQQLFRLV